MKRIYYLFSAMTVLIAYTSCNNEQESEQYVQMVSFKAPVGARGVTSIYIRYRPEGKVTYQLPLIVNGLTINSKDLNIHVGLDLDTLDALNVERSGSRKELFSKPLENRYYEFPETVQIPAGECTSSLSINSALKGLDQVDKRVLPLAVQGSDPSHNYWANPHKFYRRVMLRTSLLNDYSRQYSATVYKIHFKGNKKEAIVPEYHTSYVMGDKTIFFYADLVDIDRLNRRCYKIKFEFIREKIDLQTYKLKISSDNEDINLVMRGQPPYMVEEEMDATRPYLKHIYVAINNLEYEFTGYTPVPGYPLEYIVKGSLTMERKINTQIPDEGQAIEW